MHARYATELRLVIKMLVEAILQLLYLSLAVPRG
jgi:hypothetical protein